MVTEVGAPVFAAVSDLTRRSILNLLAGGELSAGEIAAQFQVSRPAISRHIRVLKNAGLVREKRVAQSRIYSLDPAPLQELDRWLAGYRAFWIASSAR